MNTRYALCGLSNRGISHFARPLLGTAGPADDYSATSRLVALIDTDEARARQFLEKQAPNAYDAPTWFAPADFDAMVDATRPDVVLVASPDRTHVDYILAALRRGLDVVTEKPMTSTAADAARVLEAEAKSAGKVRVTHNMRYTSRHRQIRRLIQSGAIGDVTHASLDYHVDISHGASYFLRWNRQRANSGGLSIHKSSHHLDLMNWLIGDLPRTVFAFGALNYYGPNGANRPPLAAHATAAELRALDPYYLAQRGTGVFPDDGSVDRPGAYGLSYPGQYPAGQDLYLYDAEIDIEDTYSSVIQYRRGASLAYSIDFSSPWEGYVLGISGTRGRIEADFGKDVDGRPRRDEDVLTYYPLFGEPQQHRIGKSGGDHDGSDALLRRNIFGGGIPESDELSLKATTLDGAYAVAAGEAMWRSVATGLPIDVDSLLGAH